MGVVQNSKVRRFAFELKMQDKSTFLLAADSEAEMEEWISTLNKILHSSFEQAMQEKRNGDLNDDEDHGKAEISSGSFPDNFQVNCLSSQDASSVEPFYVVLSLFDVQNSRKISADFHVDLNHPMVRQMTCGHVSGSNLEIIGDGLPEGLGLAPHYPTQGVFSVTCPHPEIFLVARIEKVLQGGITHCTEPYMKSSDSTKVSKLAEMFS
ncbi:hypothetical protein GOODEAATRI_025261 [Goodea atripinnis]|uniref:PH domain-containing protein n=1 Tax=Goodea atripinnis TaxID=208336 RepID=A0ABV0MKQ5_9TELE